MKKSFQISLFFILSFLYSCRSLAVVKGSESAVSVEPLAIFPASDSDNTLLGFGWFKNGFTLEDSTTTCTFDSVYPVSGDITLNGGALYLSRDLILQNTTSLLEAGEVFGNDYVIGLCSSITSFSHTFTLHDTTIAFGGDFTLTNSIFFDGNCHVDGRGYHVNLSGDGTLIVTEGSTLKLDKVELSGVGGNNILCQNDDAKLILHDVSWIQEKDFTFEMGSILIDHSVSFAGTCTFFYASSQTSTIDVNSRWSVVDGITLQVGRKEAFGSVEPLCFADDTSKLLLDDSSLIITSSGIGLTNGCFEFYRDIHIDVASTTTTHGLIIGTGEEEHDFSMKLDSGAAVHLLSGCWVYNNYNSRDRLEALSTVSQCIRYGDSIFYVQSDWVIPEMLFKIASGFPVSTLADGVSLRYNQTSMATSDTNFVVTGGEAAPGFLLEGGDSIYLVSGFFAFPVYVSGSGNLFSGVGDITGTVTLQDEDSILTLRLNGSILETPVMNGGKLILDADCYVGPDISFSGSAQVDLQTSRMVLGPKVDTWGSDIAWTGDGGYVSFRADVDLTGTWTFNGNCIIDGRNSMLSLNGGKIVVAEGGRLTFKNIILDSISSDDIRCLDDDGTILFDTVSVIQDGHFVFDTGSIEFKHDVDFQGSYSFIYDSAQTSTIAKNATWTCSEGIVLQVGRKDGFDGNEPIAFADNSSTLQIRNASFLSTSSGINFTKGVVRVTGNMYLDGLSTVTEGGIIFGSGDPSDDVQVYFDAGSSFKWRSGWVVYNNSQSGGFITASEGSEVISYPDSGLYIMSDYTFPTMKMRSIGLSQTILADGVTVRYENVKMSSDYFDADITAETVSDIEFKLGGNGDFFYLSKGFYPGILTIEGSNNILRGSGDLSGYLILSGPTTELSCQLNGTIFGEVLMYGGTISLENDLILGPDIVLTGPGNVNLNSSRLIIGPNDVEWLTDLNWEATGGSISLKTDLDLVGTWTINGSCTIDGNNNVLNLDGGKIIVAEGAQLTLKNILLDSVSSDDIRCLDDAGVICFDNATVVQDGHVTFDTGSIEFKHEVDFQGSYSFIYDSAQTSTISANATWSCKEGLILKAGRKDGFDGNEPFAFEDESSIIQIMNSSFVCTESGLRFTNGTLRITGDVVVDGLSTVTSGGIIFGDGQSENDIRVYFDAGSSFKWKSGWVIYNNFGPNGFVTASEGAEVICYPDSAFYVMRDYTFPTMKMRNIGLPTVVKEDGVTVEYVNVKMVTDYFDADISGESVSDIEFKLRGNEAFYLSKGVYPGILTVEGSGNTLHGSGDISGYIVLTGPTAELTCQLNGTVLGSFLMYGGSLLLNSELVLGPEVVLMGPGSINLGVYCLVVRSHDVAWETDLSWEGNGGCISLKTDLDLVGTWTFSGNCIIDGNNNLLNLDGGKIIVDQGSQLTFKNILLDSVSSDDIRCLDDDGIIHLDNVTIIQDGHFTFDTGSIEFKHEVDFQGTYSFVYDSAQTSTIKENSTWCCKEGLILTSGRKEGFDGNEPFAFENESSIIQLMNSSFVSTASGLNFTKGTLRITGDVVVDGLSTVTNGGVMFGSGQSSDDIRVYFDAGSSFKWKSGWVIYNNAGPNGFISASEGAEVISYPDSSFYIMKDYIFPTMKMRNIGLPGVTKDDGVTIEYVDVNMMTDYFDAEISGESVSDVEFKIRGGGEFFSLNNGYYPGILTVESSSNFLRGFGDLSGYLVLAGPAAELVCELNGTIFGQVLMYGGTILLGGDLALGPDVVLTGPGAINLDVHSVLVRSRDVLWETDLSWDGNGGSISLRTDVDLAGTWTFSGICIIDGNNNVLNLDGGKLVVAEGSQLTLKNILLDSVSSDDIRCLDDAGILCLDNATIVQNGHFVFDTGSIEFKHDVDFQGSYSFIYDSAQTSTITMNSTFRCKEGLILKTGRKDGFDGNEPFVFEDESSVIQLLNSSFVSTESGLRFTKGTLRITGDVTIDGLSTVTSGGIVFGDGQVENDIHVYFDAGASFKWKSGWVVYNNFEPNGFTTASEGAEVICYPDSSFYVKNDYTFPTMKMRNIGFPVVMKDDGVAIDYIDIKMVTDYFSADITAETLSDIEFKLRGGGDFFYLTKGTYPGRLTVEGASNTLRGSGNISGDIVLADVATDLTYQLNGLVSGGVSLYGGTIILDSDLILGPDIVLTGSGEINLGGNRLVISSNDVAWSTNLSWEGNSGYISLRTDVDLSGTWTFNGICTIEGNSNVLTLDGGTIVVAENAQLIFKNIILDSVSLDAIKCLDDSGIISFDNTTVIQDGHFVFDTGRIEFKHGVDFQGSYSFIYDSAQTSTIAKNATWTCSEGIVLQVGRKDGFDGNEPIAFADNSSTLQIRNASFLSTSSGINFTKGVVRITGNMYLDGLSTVTEGGIVFGSGDPSDDVQVYFDAGSSFKWRSGWVVYNNSQSGGFITASEGSEVISYPDSGLYIMSDYTFPTMKMHSIGLSQTILADGVTVRYENVKMTNDYFDADVTAETISDIEFKLNGNGDFFYLSKGSYPGILTVEGSNNILRGTGDLSGYLILSGPTTELSCQLNGTIFGEVLMYGGTILLGGDLILGPDVFLTGPGNINLGAHRLVIGPKDIEWASDLFLEGDGGSIELKAGLDLEGTWTISGTNVVIDGGGNILNLNGLGNIIVDEGTTLVFNNVRLSGISGNQLRCLGDDSAVILDNVTWVQDEDFVFSTGIIQWKHDVKMQGDTIFAYQSSQTSSILAKSNLKLDAGFTFSYNPVASISQELISFVDETSCLILNGASLRTTATGMILTKGKLIVKDESFIGSEILTTEEGDIINEGITLGNGVDEISDMICEIATGAVMNLIEGSLNYKNVSPSSWNMFNTLSILKLSSNTTLNIFEDLYLGDGHLASSAQAFVNSFSNKRLIGSVFITE